MDIELSALLTGLRAAAACRGLAVAHEDLGEGEGKIDAWQSRVVRALQDSNANALPKGVWIWRTGQRGQRDPRH